MKNYTWTVAIIAQFEVENDIEYIEFENAILSQPEKPFINYVLLFYDKAKSEACIKKANFRTTQFEVISGEEMHPINFLDLTYLEHFFTTYVYKAVQQEIDIHRNLLLTWGHGAGMGFFPEKVHPDQCDISEKSHITKIFNTDAALALLKSALSIDDSYLHYNKLDTQLSEALIDSSNYYSNAAAYKSVSLIEDKIKRHRKTISVEDIRNVIKKALRGQRINIILAMNCYMQMFETGYILRDVADIMIAPQTTISFYGYNYNELFKLLHSKPESKSEAIAKNVTDYFFLKYTDEIINSTPAWKLNLDKISISANNLEPYKDLLELIDEICCYFIEKYDDPASSTYKVPQIKWFIKNARRKCMWLTAENSGIVDLFHFLYEFGRLYDQDDFEDLWRSKYLKLNKIKSQILISITQSHQVHDPEIGFNFMPSKSPHSISVFFPFLQDSDLIKFIKKEFYSCDSTAILTFMQQSQWAKFIAFILREITKP